MSTCQNLTNFFSNLVHDPFGFGEIATGIEFDQTDDLTRSVGAAFDRSVRDYNSAEALVKCVLGDLTFGGRFEALRMLMYDRPDIDPNYLYEGQPLSTTLIEKFTTLIIFNSILANNSPNFYNFNQLTKSDLGRAFDYKNNSHLLNKVVIPAVHFKDENLYEVVETFLKNGASPNAVDDKGRSPLFTALNMTDREIGEDGRASAANCRPDEKLIEMFLTHGVIVDDKSRLLLTIPNANESGIDKKKLLDDLDNNRIN